MISLKIEKFLNEAKDKKVVVYLSPKDYNELLKEGKCTYINNSGKIIVAVYNNHQVVEVHRSKETFIGLEKEYIWQQEIKKIINE